jgi:WD40 repeat protein
VSPCNSLLVSASLDKTVLVWDVHTQAPLRRLRGHEGGVTGLHVAYTSAVLSKAEDQQHPTASASDGSDSATAHDTSTHTKAKPCLLLATASTDRTVRLWKLPSGEAVHTLTGICSLLNSPLSSHCLHTLKGSFLLLLLSALSSDSVYLLFVVAWSLLDCVRVRVRVRMSESESASVL